MTQWKKVTGTLAASALVLGTLAPVATAEPGFRGGRGGRHQGFGMRGAMQKLELTEEQRAQFEEIARQHREAMKPVREQAKALRAQLREALDGGADATRVGQLVLEQKALRDRMKADRRKLQESFVALLTPEQKARWEELRKGREERRQRMQERRGRGPAAGR